MDENKEIQMQKLKRFYDSLPWPERKAILENIGIEANSFYRILRGEREPTFSSVKKILKADKRITLEMLGVDDE
jgi:hypothetical protein